MSGKIIYIHNRKEINAFSGCRYFILRFQIDIHDILCLDSLPSNSHITYIQSVEKMDNAILNRESDSRIANVHLSIRQSPKPL